ncbi:hypothetical protein R3P38DRAFT_3227262 [Favolaschia claudopus]|uniref:Uncharacterized protein n=1 Tax=Favolaschia claudopus TaxID=2862362 RepID=A0AAV9ZSC2_9AGAR
MRKIHASLQRSYLLSAPPSITQGAYCELSIDAIPPSLKPASNPSYAAYFEYRYSFSGVQTRPSAQSSSQQRLFVGPAHLQRPLAPRVPGIAPPPSCASPTVRSTSQRPPAPISPTSWIQLYPPPTVTLFLFPHHNHCPPPNHRVSLTTELSTVLTHPSYLPRHERLWVNTISMIRTFLMLARRPPSGDRLSLSSHGERTFHVPEQL